MNLNRSVSICILMMLSCLMLNAQVASPPVFTSTAITTISEGDIYSYVITTNDPDRDLVSITTPTKPNWLNLINTPEYVSTIAGSGAIGSVDGTGTSAQFNAPYGITVDNSGNLYICDWRNHRIRKMTPTGVVTTFAGSSQGFADGTGTTAQFYNPGGITTDASGNFYVTDGLNHKIRKITPAGVVTTFAGSFPGDADGTGTAAQFKAPSGIAIDNSGNIFVSDTQNHRIRKITPTGVVTTLAGSTSGFSDGTGTAAKFNFPNGLTIDSSNNIYIADAFNNRIRKITPAGVVTTLAGSFPGFLDGTVAVAKFNSPIGMAVDNSDNIYVTDRSNHRIRKITPSGDVTTIAGSSSGYNDGVGTTALFRFPLGVSIDPVDNTIYVADGLNNRIRKITDRITLTGNSTGNAGTHNVVLEANDGNGGTTQQSFAVMVIAPPTVTTSAATAISTSEATLHGEATLNGLGTIIERGFVYALTSSDATPTVSEASGATVTKVVVAGSAGSFSNQITNLLAHSGYSFAAYAINNAGGVVEGTVQTFTTLNSAPTFTSTPITAATEGTYSYTVTTNDLDGDSVSITAITKPSWLNFDTGAGILSGDSTGNTGTHNVVLEANDGNGGVIQQSFTITIEATPIVTNSTATELTTSGVTLSGEVALNGEGTIVERGFVYSLTTDALFPSVAASSGDLVTKVVASGTGTGSFSSQITGLPPHTHYYFAAYAINNAGGVTESPVQVFTTLNSPPIFTSAPIITTTIDEGDIFSYTFTANDPDGDVVRLIRSGGSLWLNFNTETGVLSGDSTGNPGINNMVVIARDSYGGSTQQSFTIIVTAAPAPPTVITPPVTEITASGATLTGFIVSNDGGLTITERGFVYALTSDDATPTLAEVNGTTVIKATATSGYINTITGLLGKSDYSLAAYATNSLGTNQGAVETFTTLNNVPTFTSTPVTSIAEGSVYFYTVTTNDLDGDQVSITVSTKPDWLSFNATTGILSGDSTGNLGIHNVVLEANDGSGGIVQQSFTISVLTIPTVSTSTAEITPSGATLNGFIASDGGATITERGFVYSLTSDDATPTLEEVNGTNVIKVIVETTIFTGTTGNINSDITDLLANGDYSFVAYATNSVGNSYGAVETFTSIENTWSSGTTGDWNTESNWSIGVPNAGSNVTLPSGIVVTSSLPIFVNSLIIPSDGALNSSSTVIINTGTITIQSDNENSGVLLASTITNNVINYERGGFIANKWSIVSAPVSGQKIKDFVENVANDIRINTTVTPNRYAVAYYDDSQPVGSKWVYYDVDFLTANPNVEFEVGRSYAMSRATNGAVTFTGAKEGVLNKSITASQWNAIGNPFTAFLPANQNSNLNFINGNIANFDPTNVAIYVWDNAQDRYIARSLADATATSLAPGKGFFVRAATEASSMQFSFTTLQPSSGNTSFNRSMSTPSIQLFATLNGLTIDTNIKYFDHATKGLDPGYDVASFGGSDFDLYTKLLDDYQDVDFTIQSLPLDDYENMIIPVGFKASSGDLISFSAKALNLPPGIDLYLEDRALNSFEKLGIDNQTYQVTLSQDTNGTGRFYIHTTSNVLDVGEPIELEGVQVFTTKNHTLHVKGVDNQKAFIKIYNTLGVQVFNHSFQATEVDLIALPKLKTGIYIVYLHTENGRLNKKIVIE
jgi:sugar lactone lactonase YvrE